MLTNRSFRSSKLYKQQVMNSKRRMLWSYSCLILVLQTSYVYGVPAPNRVESQKGTCDWDTNCGRGGLRCTDGKTCQIHPSDAFAICCTEECLTESTCDDDDSCPPGYQCERSTGNFSDGFAICCKSGERPGECPKDLVGGLGICALECNSDSECPDPQKCCENSCGGTVCAEPETTAPTAAPCDNLVNCFVDPCRVTTCERYPNANCVSNYCGGCNAEFFLAGENVTDYCSERTTATTATTDCDMVMCFADPCEVNQCPKYPNAKCKSNFCGGCNAEYYVDDVEVTSDCALETTSEAKVTGECPSTKGMNGMCVELCSSDLDCQSGTKCCSNGCGHTCLAPVTELPTTVTTIRPGECPSTEGMIGTCVEMCSADSDCSEPAKCCSNGCGYVCMNPVTEPTTTVTLMKPGQCPSTEGMMGVCAEMCSSDSDCDGEQKCCSNGCGHSCAQPVAVMKPGQCPSMEGMMGMCAEMCSGDSDCSGEQKCCSNGCGHYCTQPVPVMKPGQCPSTEGMMGICTEMCSVDSDCNGKEKCCSNGCGHSCRQPVAVIKPGQCPSTEEIKGICTEMCSGDSDCDREQKCCSNGCGHSCTLPVTEITSTPDTTTERSPETTTPDFTSAATRLYISYFLGLVMSVTCFLV